MRSGLLQMRYAEVNGESQNRCVQGMGEFVERKNRTGKACPAKERNMEVFGDDFATVYFREDYATIAAPKRQNFGGFEKWKEVQKIFYKLQYICELTV